MYVWALDQNSARRQVARARGRCGSGRSRCRRPAAHGRARNGAPGSRPSRGRTRLHWLALLADEPAGRSGSSPDSVLRLEHPYQQVTQLLQLVTP